MKYTKHYLFSTGVDFIILFDIIHNRATVGNVTHV